MQGYRASGLLVGALVLVTAGELTAQSEASSRLPEEVQAYTLEYEKARSPTRSGRGIEALYRKGIAAGKALLSENSEQLVLLEALDQDQLRSARRALPGLFVNREEVLEAFPDPERFFTFAIEWGDRADIAFFSMLTMSYASPGWPVYIDRQTDYGGCRRLGSFVFSELYEMWRWFQSRFPDRYKEEARREVANLEREILHTGACESATEVAKAYREFLRAFPGAPVAGEIQVRIDAIESGTSHLRFESRPR